MAPFRPHAPDWPWLTAIAPMRSRTVRRLFIRNTLDPAPKLTFLYRRWQFLRAARAIRGAPLTFLFSTDIGIAMTSWPVRAVARPRVVYVGFTQDGPWPSARIRRVAGALRRCEAVTMFTEEERRVYVDRYGVDPARARVIPIHTDETDDYSGYPDTPPRTRPYALSLGSPNRRFTPVARVCRELGIDLVVITRPGHRLDSLETLAGLGAEIITDADRTTSLTYLKHARVAIAAFDDPGIPGGFTTLVHAMFLRTPFVVTDCLGMAEHVIDGETGFVTPHDDEDALRDAVGRLWSEPDTLVRFGEAAALRGRERHSLPAAAARFDALVAEMLGEGPPVTPRPDTPSVRDT